MSKIKIFNIRRYVAVFMAMLITVLSLSYTNSNYVNAVNSDATYYVYNAKTAEKIRNYTLSKLGSSDNTRAIIGNNEMGVDWTSGVVKLINPIQYLGSGFIVSDHVIATAAHCVYNLYTKKTDKIEEILAFDTSGNVTLHATPVEVHIPKKYTTEGLKRHKYDYALITVKEDLSDYIHFNLGVPLDSFANGNKNATVTVTGFPEYVEGSDPTQWLNDIDVHAMYSGSGSIYGNIDTEVFDKQYSFGYTADMTGGTSGGPVYITESLDDKTYYTVVGINICNLPGENPQYNVGTRMTTDLIHFYTGNNTNINW